MKRGYSKNRNYKLPTLSKQSCEFQQQQRKEKQLLMQVQKIDSILKSDNLKSMHGFIFTNEVKNRLSQDLLTCIHKQHRLISYGFEILSKNNSKEQEFQSGKINSNYLTFKAKLQKIGIRNVEDFESKKNQQLSQLKNQQWQLKVLQKRALDSRQRDYSVLFSYENLTKSSATTPKKRGILNEENTRNKKLQTEILQSPDKDQITLYRIEKMLQRHKDNLVGIWLPPKSYPQFYGIIVPIIKTASLTLKCRLKKYILFKQGLNNRLFQAILDYLSEKYRVQIDSLQMIVNKQDFYAYFQKMGCKIKSWQGIDKVLIGYFRKTELE